MAKRHDHLDRPRGGQIDKITQVLQNELICNAKPQACLRLNNLSLSIANLNRRIRSTGLPEYKQWIGRNQFTEAQSHTRDSSLMDQQTTERNASNNKT